MISISIPKLFEQISKYRSWLTWLKRGAATSNQSTLLKWLLFLISAFLINGAWKSSARIIGQIIDSTIFFVANRSQLFFLVISSSLLMNFVDNETINLFVKWCVDFKAKEIHRIPIASHMTWQRTRELFGKGNA